MWALLMAVFNYSEAQRAISGTVLDGDNGDPIIGSTVVVKETGNGTITDIDGKFNLDISSEAETLVFSYTGYARQEVILDGRDVYNINLSFGELLDEVIVIGYGTVKREDATGSIQSVNSEYFNKGALTGPQELLSGKVAGVTITSNGDPGGGSKIRIRGESSINASNDPLIVIDGVPLANEDIAGNRNPLDIINPNDIETFTVLKDASATAIYGNRASGGVILITTKKGTTGDKYQLGISANANFSKISKKVDVLNSSEYREAFLNYYGDQHPAFVNLGDQDTDWQDEIYQTAFGHEYNINYAHRIANIPFRVSAGYLNKDGVLKTDNYQRSTLGLNLNPSYLDNRLQVNLGLKAIDSKNRFADKAAIGNALSFDPTQEVLSENDFGGYTAWLDVNGNPELLSPTNPVAQLNLKNDQADVNRYIANASLDYRFKFLPQLRANLNMAYDETNSEGTVLVDTLAAFEFDPNTGGGTRNIYTQERSNKLLEFYLNYQKDMGMSRVDLMTGYSWQEFGYYNYFKNSDFALTPAETTEGVDSDDLYLLSLYGRLNYSYNSKYLLTLSLRRDGTSRFGPDNRWGLFPAAALGIKLIENENKIFNNAKLRLGWGITGQESIGNKYAYLPQYTLGFENASYQFGDEYVLTQRPEGYDSNIKWEETETINVGLDFSIIKNRLSGSLDLYQKKTTDLLNRIPVPAGTNLTNFVTTNVGNMDNQGVELSLFMSPISTPDLSWDLAFNTAYNKNEITKLTATDDPSYNGIIVGGIAGGVGSNIQIHSVGFAPFSFYVKEQVVDENGAIVEGEFVDLNEDGIDNDFYRAFKPASDYTFGLSSNFNYKNFGLSFGIRAQTGGYIYNNVQTNQGWINRMVNSSNILYNVNQSAIDLEVFEQGNLTFSDFFLEKADFIRMDHLTLSYGISGKKGYRNNFSITIQNPFLITGYSGLDPETEEGIDNDIYPRPRTIVFGWSFNI